MPSATPRRHGVHLLLALLMGLAAALPVPALAAAPTGAPLTEGAARPVVNRWSLDARVDEHPADRPMVLRGFAPVWRFEAERAALEAIAAAKAAAEQAAAEAAAKAAAPSYAGKNHVWIPSLGVSRSVEGFACSRSTPPANRMYRWGCAGKNNLYLFGHAWGVMKPVHDAYVAGSLKKGMVVVYADAGGHVRKYRVTETRVVTPDQIDWAIAAQSRPSMTLQTCLGANSEKRLLVRLVADG
jgi:sortase (surface protein transpeptidase)